MSSHLFDRVRRRRGRPTAASAPAGHPYEKDVAGLVYSDLASEWPEEDLREDLADCFDIYRVGSKPPCEEAEYLAVLKDAMDRIARGR